MALRTSNRFRSIAELHQAYRQGAVSPLDVVRSSIQEAAQDDRNAVLHVCERRALAQAQAAADLLKKTGSLPADKPLFGVPVGIKDNLVIDGVRTTCASRVLENYIPPYTATAVARLEAAGAIPIAKLNLDEFAMGGSNENSAFGPVKHPTHPDRVPGGSSGGSAVAARLGYCQATLGSDTGGSIRLPAAYCGVVGIKPTYGRVSRYGLVAFASSLDQVGPLARSVGDAAVMLDAITGHDPWDSTSLAAFGGEPAGSTRCTEAIASGPGAWSSLRVGVPEEFFVPDQPGSPGLSSEVLAPVQRVLDRLKAMGATLVPIRLPHARYSIAVYYLVAVSEASSNLARFDGVRYGARPPGAADAGDLLSLYKKVRAGFGPEVKRRILLGTFALSAGYSDAYYRRACQVRRLIQQDFDRAYDQVDLIAGPVAATPAFKLGEKSGNPLQMYLNDLYTVPANLAGIPAMSLPCGETEQGLPVGIQLMAPAFGEERMIQVAHAIESLGLADRGGR